MYNSNTSMPETLVQRYQLAYMNLHNLVDELENRHGRFLVGSPRLIDILHDMLERGIKDDRIQPVINKVKQVNLEVSLNREAFEILRS